MAVSFPSFETTEAGAVLEAKGFQMRIRQVLAGALPRCFQMPAGMALSFTVLDRTALPG